MESLYILRWSTGIMSGTSQNCVVVGGVLWRKVWAVGRSAEPGLGAFSVLSAELSWEEGR